MKREKAVQMTHHEPRESKWLDLIELVAVIALVFIYPTLTHTLSDHASAPTTLGQKWSSLFFHIGYAVLFWIILCRDKTWRVPLPEKKSGWLKELAYGLLILFAMIFIRNIYHGIFNNAGFRPDPPSSNTYGFVKDGGAPGIICAVVTSFFSVVREEIICRAYLIRRLQLLLKGNIWPVLIASALFSYYHAYPLKASFFVFSDGVLFGAIYALTNRLPRLIVGHWLYNLTVILK